MRTKIMSVNKNRIFSNETPFNSLFTGVVSYGCSCSYWKHHMWTLMWFTLFRYNNPNMALVAFSNVNKTSTPLPVKYFEFRTMTNLYLEKMPHFIKTIFNPPEI